MSLRRCLFLIPLFPAVIPVPLFAAPPHPAPCHQATLEADLTAGHAYAAPIGNGLSAYFQPIHSGWILRIVPSGTPHIPHDYAELATPPYQSVSPLSLSTDFSFRAQDAVGWNPRRFRFATSAASFARLNDAYQALIHAGATPPAPIQLDLSQQIAEAADGTLTILDARLVPGTADQGRAAAAVALHFTTTAHSVATAEPPSPLGKLISIRFRLVLDLPASFAPAASLHVVPHICGTR